jgi:BirA family transcriptional regulator, biotin operon repressor / biotin---[acetyl-CoA-carboxylase] ligase
MLSGSAEESPKATGWPFVRTMVEREVVDSTSNVAAQLVREGSTALPLAVWAHRQTRGRGRGTREWWSDEGSLTFTLAIDPAAHRLALTNEPKVALSTAVAVIDALGELGFHVPDIGIRWPNDLECGGRKLGGILPERLESSDGHRMLIGVGLNVRTNLVLAPEEVQSMATSLGALSPRPIDNQFSARLLAAILRHFESILGRLVLGENDLAARWNGLDLLRDSLVRVDVGTHVVTGTGRGIDADGAIRLDDGRATIRLFGGRVLRSSGEAPCGRQLIRSVSAPGPSEE